MHMLDIKDEKLRRLMKAAENYGGTLYDEMYAVLTISQTEEGFVVAWYSVLRNEMNAVAGFYNAMAERTGHEKAVLVL